MQSCGKPAGDRYLAALRLPAAVAPLTASRRYAGLADSGFIPVAASPRSQEPAALSCVRVAAYGNTSSWASRAAARGRTRKCWPGAWIRSTSPSGIPSGGTCSTTPSSARRSGARWRRACLVGDNLVESVVKQRLSEHDWNYGFIIDGFRARSGRRSSSWRVTTSTGSSIWTLPDAEVARRVLARRLCAGCGMDYSLIDNSPAEERRCDACGGELVRRQTGTR